MNSLTRSRYPDALPLSWRHPRSVITFISTEVENQTFTLQRVLPWRKISCAGILTCCPSVTPFGLTLGPTNPKSINVAWETLGLRWPDFSSSLKRYSYHHFHFLSLHSSLRSCFTAIGTLLYRLITRTASTIAVNTVPVTKPVSSVRTLSPVEFSAQNHIDQ